MWYARRENTEEHFEDRRNRGKPAVERDISATLEEAMDFSQPPHRTRDCTDSERESEADSNLLLRHKLQVVDQEHRQSHDGHVGEDVDDSERIPEAGLAETFTRRDQIWVW